MRWYKVVVSVAVLLLGVFAVALSQGDEQMFIPTIRSGAAEDSPTPVPTETPMPDPDFYVDDDNTSGTEDGSTLSPYNTLQEAITAASDGDTIAVATGTYSENVRIENRIVHLFGGYAGGNATSYAGGDGGDFTTRNATDSSTHILGDGTDSVVTLIEAFTSRVDGFRITGGTRSLVPEFGDRGGGIFVRGGSPLISHNLIENNNTHLSGVEEDEPLGGGIFAEGADIAILNNTIRNNVSGRGGGIAISGGMVTIRGNTVQGNSGVGAISDHGGGLYIASPHAEISHNRIIGNEIGRGLGYGWGGGIIVYGAETFAHLSYNIVTENYAPSVGSGIFVDDGARAVIDHELIYNNVCPDGGTTGGVGIYVDGYDNIGSHVTLNHITVADHDCITQGGNGLYVEVNSVVTITNSIFWGNGGEDFSVDDTSKIFVTYTTSEEFVAGVGNLAVDPLFADAAAHDYHLQSTTGRLKMDANSDVGEWLVDANHSPAIDAGDPASPFAQEPTPNGSRANMGVYGNTPGASKSSP